MFNDKPKNYKLASNHNQTLAQLAQPANRVELTNNQILVQNDRSVRDRLASNHNQTLVCSS